jgi:tetratricopeptide (TPR) repeat protein
VSFYNLYVTANIESGRQELTDSRPIEAEKYFRNAMLYPENLGTGQPSSPDASQQLYWLGNALDAEGKHGQAEEAWRSAANRGKNYGGSCRIFPALAVQKSGDQKTAREMFEQCVRNGKQSKPSAGTLFNAGLAEQYSGDAAQAREDFHRALAVDPLYWRARIALIATE